MTQARAPQHTLSASPRLTLEVFAWRFGWLWLLVITLAIAIGAGALLVLSPLQTQITRARETRIDVSAQLAELTLRPAAARVADTNVWLDSVLPTASASDRHIQEIYSTADRHELEFTNSVLRTTENPKAGISRTEITLPVRGTYPRIAAFVETLLREQPHLSVDQLRFRRVNVAASEGEAEIRISCWMHSAVAPPAKRAPAKERAS